MTSLIESLLPQIERTLAPQIAAKLGIDEALVPQGIALATPMIIGALARNTSSKDGAASLTNALQRDHTGNVLENPNTLLERYNSGEGSAILGHLFGQQRPAIEQALTTGSGVEGSSLLQMLAPAIMGALGQAQQQHGLDATGVAQLVQGEQRQLEQTNGDLMQTATKLLDSNGDGSMTDEMVSMVSKLFRR